MSKLKIYISSTYLDLGPLRRRILDCIQIRLKDWFGFTTIMEMMPGDEATRSDIDTCLANVRKADIYIILLGKRYGSIPPQYTNADKEIIKNNEGKSYTWLEYEAACQQKKIKRIYVYKLEVTDAFFDNAQLDAQSDLADEQKKECYDKFILELSKTASAIPINSLNQLGDEVNLAVTRSHLKHNTITQLQLTDEDTCSIDRKSQVELLSRQDLDPQSSVASLIVNSKNHDEDEVAVFSRKIRQIFRPDEIAEIQRNLRFVNLNALAVSTSDDMNKVRDTILVASSSNIFGARASKIKFDKLYEEIQKRNIQNRFLGYEIDLRLESEQTIKLIGYLQNFIQHLNKFLEENGFIYNFFVILSVVTEDDLSGQFIQKYMPGLDTDLYDLKRLSDIELSDIDAWFDMIISNKNAEFITNFNSLRSELVEQIFIDTRLFPKSYKQCLIDIHSRAK